MSSSRVSEARTAIIKKTRQYFHKGIWLNLLSVLCSALLLAEVLDGQTFPCKLRLKFWGSVFRDTDDRYLKPDRIWAFEPFPSISLERTRETHHAFWNVQQESGEKKQKRDFS